MNNEYVIRKGNEFYRRDFLKDVWGAELGAKVFNSEKEASNYNIEKHLRGVPIKKNKSFIMACNY